MALTLAVEGGGTVEVEHQRDHVVLTVQGARTKLTAKDANTLADFLTEPPASKKTTKAEA